MQNTEKPTKPESDYKKKIAERINVWKTRGEKWWHHRFPNLIKYILLFQPVAQSSDAGVGAAIFHHARVMSLHVTSPSENAASKNVSCTFC